MEKLQIEKSVKNLGEAQDFLRAIIRDLNQGIVSGRGWMIGEGEIVSTENTEVRARLLNPQLHELALSLQQAVISGQPESEIRLVAELAGLLAVEGYGMGDEYRPDSSETEPGQAEGGAGGESVGSGDIVQPVAPQEATEGGQKVENGDVPPWEKK